MTDEAPAPALLLKEEPSLITLGDASVFDVFETDSSAEESGRWFDLFGDRGDGEIRLRGFTSKASMNTRKRLEAVFRRQQSADGSYSTEVMNVIICQQLADAIIVDWRGKAWREKDGTPLPFSKENALRLVTLSTYLRNRVAALAGDMDSFRYAAQEEITKN